MQCFPDLGASHYLSLSDKRAANSNSNTPII